MALSRHKYTHLSIVITLIVASFCAAGLVRAQIETRSGEFVDVTEAFPDMALTGVH